MPNYATPFSLIAAHMLKNMVFIFKVHWFVDILLFS